MNIRRGLLFLFLVTISARADDGTQSASSLVRSSQAIAVISAGEPMIFGRSEGILVGREWYVVDPNYNLNGEILKSIRASINREAQFYEGASVGIFSHPPKVKPADWEKYYQDKLSELGTKWAVDCIVIVRSATAYNWITRAGRLEGSGIIYNARHHEAYCIIGLNVYDCRRHKYSPSVFEQRSQELPPIEWKANWHDYSEPEQRIIFEQVFSVLDATVPWLINNLALAKPESVPAAQANAKGRLERIPYVPKSDDLKIPEGLSRELAMAAVVAALKDRDWKIVSHTEDAVVASQSAHGKESVETVTLKENVINVAASRYEISSSGERKPVPPYERWHTNLKESILDELFKLDPSH